MSLPRLRTILLVAEVTLCFALPAYFLFWGLVTVPMWYFAALRGGTYAIWALAYVVGGCLGIVAIIAFTRYLTAPSDGRPFAAIRNTVFAIVGLASIWGTVTDDFRVLDLDWFTFAVAGVPSLCFVHFLVLALRKAGGAQSR